LVAVPADHADRDDGDQSGRSRGDEVLQVHDGFTAGGRLDRAQVWNAPCTAADERRGERVGRASNSPAWSRPCRLSTGQRATEIGRHFGPRRRARRRAEDFSPATPSSAVADELHADGRSRTICFNTRPSPTSVRGMTVCQGAAAVMGAGGRKASPFDDRQRVMSERNASARLGHYPRSKQWSPFSRL
jgi:hypothetical protein